MNSIWLELVLEDFFFAFKFSQPENSLDCNMIFLSQASNNKDTIKTICYKSNIQLK